MFSKPLRKVIGTVVALLFCGFVIERLWGKDLEWWKWGIIIVTFAAALLGSAALIASHRAWFKRDEEGAVTRLVAVLDGYTKLLTIGGVIVALYLFTLFQESTESMNLSLEVNTIKVGNRDFVKVAVKVENVGKVRVTLTAGFLRLQSAVSEADKGLSFRLIADPSIRHDGKFESKWEDRLILTSHFKDYSYPSNPAEPPAGSRLDKVPDPSRVIADNDRNSLQNDMVFDPGEKHTITYLFEYTGSGVCLLTSRFDGNQVLYYWHTSEYVRLPPDSQGS